MSCMHGYELGGGIGALRLTLHLIAPFIGVLTRAQTDPSWLHPAPPKGLLTMLGLHPKLYPP